MRIRRSSAGHTRRAAARAGAVCLSVYLAVGLWLSTLPAPAAAQYFKTPPKQLQPVPAPAQPTSGGPVTKIEGEYDVQELRRLIDVARESGFSEEQIREITVEDENGNIVNAWAFLLAHERREREKQARLAAQRDKVYLAPKDILKELDAKQQQDLDALRDKLLFVE